jgi:hypothetical protein
VNNHENREHGKYQVGVGRILLSIVTCALSFFLASLWLVEPVLVLFYVFCTFAVTVGTLELKIFGSIARLEVEEGSTSKQSGVRQRLRLVAFLVMMVIAVLFLVTFILPPESRYLLVAGIASGMSISEILFFLHYRKREN